MLIRRVKQPIRRGAAMVEAAIILPVFLVLTLGMIDLGIAVFQNNAICEASRQGARIASVHGAYAADDATYPGGVWGPSAYSGAGSATDPIPTAMRSAGALAGLNTANVTVAVSWPSGTNSVANGDTVSVKVSVPWAPVIFYVFGNKSVTLTATSIMPIAH
jgi:Flp pilus assembly protein TadG